MNTTLDLTIRCHYSRKLTPAEEARAREKLMHAAEYLACTGMLTGEEPELELINWKQSVRRVPARQRPRRS